MRKQYLIPVLLLLISGDIFGIELDGYIIDNQGVRTDVVFHLRPRTLTDQNPDFANLQREGLCYAGENKILVTAGKYQRIGLNTEEGWIEFVAVPNVFFRNIEFGSTDTLFLRIKTEGPVMVYYNYFHSTTASSYGSAMYMSQGWIVYNQLSGEFLVLKYKRLTKRQKLLELFGDCPELRKKIIGYKFPQSQILEWAEEYNLCKEGETNKTEHKASDVKNEESNTNE